MKDLFALGDGIESLSVFSTAREINDACRESGGEEMYRFRGFVVRDSSWMEELGLSDLRAGDPDTWKPGAGAVCGMGFTDPRLKKKYAERLLREGAVFETLVSPSARIRPGAVFGRGCLITAKTFVKATVKLGDFVTLTGAILGTNSRVGNYSTVLGFCNLTGAEIGDEVYIGRSVVIMTDHKHISVGSGSTVLAGSNVVNSVRPGTTVRGNPAMKVRRAADL